MQRRPHLIEVWTPLVFGQGRFWPYDYIVNWKPACRKHGSYVAYWQTEKFYYVELCTYSVLGIIP